MTAIPQRNNVQARDEAIGPVQFSGSTRDKALFLMVGGGIGAVLALLFAPKSGSALRGDISDVTKRGIDSTKELAGQVRDESANLLRSVKGRGEKVFDLASERLSRSSGSGADDTPDDLLGLNEPRSTSAGNKVPHI